LPADLSALLLNSSVFLYAENFCLAPISRLTYGALRDEVTNESANRGQDNLDRHVFEESVPEELVETDTSRNGIIIHPWGLAPIRATTDVRLHWPLIGLRVLGAEPDARHWLLLECDQYAANSFGSSRGVGTTVHTDPPRPLTPAEHEALLTVFEAVLAWRPPLTPAEPLQLKQAGRRLGVTASAVKVRLDGARSKAELLGLDHQVGVTDPTYLHVLVAAGYVPLPERRYGATRFSLPAREQD